MNDDSVTLEEANRFYGDAQVHRLIQQTAHVEPLAICYPREPQVSRFLGWLLDPSQGHGFGDDAIRALLVAAGQKDAEAQIPILDLNLRRMLSPSAVRTEGFVPSFVATEVEVGATSERQLDVLCVDLVSDVYVAIEIKVRAGQGPSQLREYRKGLDKRFPSMKAVRIFMDARETEPEDTGRWIVLGFDWLIDFLRDREQLGWLSDPVRQTVTQFRRALEEVDDESVESAGVSSLVRAVAATHPAVFRHMRQWIRYRSSGRAQALAELLKDGVRTDGERASLRLFQAYNARPEVWRRCMKQLEFAPFENTLREQGYKLNTSPKRVNVRFSLQEWNILAIPSQDSPLWVSVVILDDRYLVRGVLKVDAVREDMREQVQTAARAVRKSKLGRADARKLTLSSQEDLSLSEAKTVLLEEMKRLKLAFAMFV